MFIFFRAKAFHVAMVFIEDICYFTVSKGSFETIPNMFQPLFFILLVSSRQVVELQGSFFELHNARSTSLVKRITNKRMLTRIIIASDHITKPHLVGFS